MAYPDVNPSPSFPAVEGEVLARWDAEHTFAASLAASKDGSAGSAPPIRGVAPGCGRTFRVRRAAPLGDTPLFRTPDAGVGDGYYRAYG